MLLCETGQRYPPSRPICTTPSCLGTVTLALVPGISGRGVVWHWTWLWHVMKYSRLLVDSVYLIYILANLTLYWGMHISLEWSLDFQPHGIISRAIHVLWVGIFFFYNLRLDRVIWNQSVFFNSGPQIFRNVKHAILSLFHWGKQAWIICIHTYFTLSQ